MRLRDKSDREIIATVRRYASGKAPVLGIPVFSIRAGKYVTVVLCRSHLQAAASCPHLTRVHYDEAADTLVLNGSPRAEYRLKNLRGANSTLRWQLGEDQRKWAVSQRKRAMVAKANATPEQRMILRLQDAIRKLERKRDKIYLQVPVGPMMLTKFDREPVSDYMREDARHWIEQKPIRRRLGQLVRRERKTWASFYAEVEAITGWHVDDSRKHDRVCGRKGGPDRITYLKYLYKYIGMATRCFGVGDPVDWYARQEYGGDDHGLNAFERHRRAQVEYLADKSERAGIESEIAAHRLTILELESQAQS